MVKFRAHCIALDSNCLLLVTTYVYNVKEIMHAYDGDLCLADMSVQFLY
jgi:hypothetical protein